MNRTTRKQPLREAPMLRLSGRSAQSMTDTHRSHISDLRPPNLRALEVVALDVLAAGVGGKLPTGIDYQSRLDIGAGTVAKAIRTLEGVGATTLKARGHQGTFIMALHWGRLWDLANLPPLRVAMTTRGAVEGFALAAAMTDCAKQLGVPVEIRHKRGADLRIEMLRNGSADLAVLSAGAAQAVMGEKKTYQGLTMDELGPGTYYDDGTLLVVSSHRRRKRPLRIGIDKFSYDHRVLTKAEFDDRLDVAFVPCSFPTIPRSILEDEIDVGVWHQTRLLIPLALTGLATRPLRKPKALTMLTQLSRAVFVRRSDSPIVGGLLAELQDGGLEAAQHEIMRADPDDEEIFSDIGLR